MGRGKQPFEFVEPVPGCGVVHVVPRKRGRSRTGGVRTACRLTTACYQRSRWVQPDGRKHPKDLFGYPLHGLQLCRSCLRSTAVRRWLQQRGWTVEHLRVRMDGRDWYIIRCEAPNGFIVGVKVRSVIPMVRRSA